jgi:3-deoxy-D-manno-octulosonate 8-phosphate phosphatase (KDO 8-P phosphatase)
MACIKAIALDVDGVLTDGGFWWGPNGEEWKRFSFKDVMGVSLALKAGLIIALFSGENSSLVDRFADKMGIADVVKNCKDKAEAVRSLANRHGLALDEICYMGDDVNDLAAFELVGFCAAPADAQPHVLAQADLVTKRSGGNGAVRELINAILSGHVVPRQQSQAT